MLVPDFYRFQNRTGRDSWDELELKTTGNSVKRDCFGVDGAICGAAFIQVKDMVLKDAVEERRRKNEEMLANS